MIPTYLYEQDPGHGWLKVSINELIRLGIQDRITSYSYRNGDDVYLEEDIDMSTFLDAKEARGEPFELVPRHVENTPIRDYPGYRINHNDLPGLNAYQTAVKDAYSDGDHSHIDSVQQAQTVGDSLFAFLMIELSDAEGCTDQVTAWRRLQNAKRDIDTAINAVLSMSL